MARSTGVTKHTGAGRRLRYAVRFVTSDVAIVHATATRTEPVVLPDGKQIPPFTQQATFVLVKKNDVWRITAHNVHNQFADPHKSEKLPWESAAK